MIGMVSRAPSLLDTALVGDLASSKYPLPDYDAYAVAWPYTADQLRAFHRWLRGYLTIT